MNRLVPHRVAHSHCVTRFAEFDIVIRPDQSSSDYAMQRCRVSVLEIRNPCVRGRLIGAIHSSFYVKTGKMFCQLQIYINTSCLIVVPDGQYSGECVRQYVSCSTRMDRASMPCSSIRKGHVNCTVPGRRMELTVINLKCTSCHETVDKVISQLGCCCWLHPCLRLEHIPTGERELKI